MPIERASLYEAPFEHVRTHVKPERDKTRREKYRKVWWLFAEPIPGMRAALRPLKRYIATPAVAKHRVFVWMHKAIVPDHALVVFARDDDASFGVLHSRFHELWALRLGTSLEDRPRYTPTTTFETFPFPSGLTPNLQSGNYTNVQAFAIAEKARKLCGLRDNWLNPKEWIRRVSDDGRGYPERVLPILGREADLRMRTVTNLYNERPTWLAKAHEELDVAVARAYGWDDYSSSMSDEEVLARLLRLNLNRTRDLFSDAADRARKTFAVVRSGRRVRGNKVGSPKATRAA